MTKCVHNPLAKGINSSSLRESINAHCYMCMGGDIGDLNTKTGVVSDIRGCQSNICPLHSVRGFDGSKPGGKRS